MQSLLEKGVSDNFHWTSKGKTASYIPELSNVRPSQLGVCITNNEGDSFCGGDFYEPFTLQSVAKPFILLQALLDNGENEVFKKVGMEPSGDTFNSLVRLEITNPNKPYNPMINAGAFVTYSLVKGPSYEDRFMRILKLIKGLTGNSRLIFNNAVYESERLTGDRNRSIAYLMKSSGIIPGNVEELVDAYFKTSSISVNCKDISIAALVLANHGVCPFSNEKIVPHRYTQIVNAIMSTCGLYDESGEFAVNVGLPSKSGVSGAIMSVVPNRMGIGVFSPALNEKGNSYAGIKLLETLNSNLSLNIY